MEKFVKDDIVVIPFPFSDLSGAKRRPALVLADLQGDDIILCQITSQMTKDKYAISINDKDYISNKLTVLSNIRSNRIFTADKNIIIRRVSSINGNALENVIKQLFEIITS